MVTQEQANRRAIQAIGRIQKEIDKLTKKLGKETNPAKRKKLEKDIEHYRKSIGAYRNGIR